ncbi:hypothetical protein KL925_001817 [Ogataea polymorpha]|nr:hypothetical protein KL925_001817 [Ogataea polymorpha]
MSSSATASTDNTKQHDLLRQRLQYQLQVVNNTLEAGEYDWFLREAPTGSTLSPIKSPSLATSSNNKALPSVSAPDTDIVASNHDLLPLRRSRTVDGTTSHTKEDFGTSSLTRSCTNVLSPSCIPEPKKHGGFLRRIFGREERPRSRSSSVSVSSVSAPPASEVPRPSRQSTEQQPKEEVKQPQRAPSEKLSSKYKDLDPKLYEYLKDIEDTMDYVDSPEYNVFAPTIESHIKYSPEEIPPHPDKPKLPSAFSLHPKYNHPVEEEECPSTRDTKESVFGSFLKLSRNKDASHLSPHPSRRSSISISYVPPPPKVEKSPPIKALRDVKPIRKVAFATTTFVNDPPQQIPSRHPRKGNVEVGPDGELIIHKLSPEEQKTTSSGIVVGGSGHLRLVHQDSSESMQRSPSDQTINQHDKVVAAEKARTTGDSMGPIDDIKIDKPMVRRRKPMEKPVVTLKLDELYTRCCHLREILPIPATLKQIPKGSTDPLPILQLRNPHPSLIEVLSFADFVRIAPIHCVSLDGVSMTHEMFRTLLAALLSKRHLEKLSLRNTPIDAEGWKMLCWFLSMNKALTRLDLTQCPSLDLNLQKLRKPADTRDRMTCNIQDRSDMDWSLLTATLMVRRGINEMVLSGCKINDLAVFRDFLKLGLKNTMKIGLAFNDLSLSHIEIVVDWMKESSNVVGVDLGYNDLSTKLRPFIEYTKQENFRSSLALLSLNSCNLRDNEDTVAVFDAFSKFSHLKYLDLSNNKKLFETFMHKFVAYLPLFQDLHRLNLDGNDFSQVALIQLSETLPLMKNLNYLSIKQNVLTKACCESLCQSLKYSRSLFNIDYDLEGVPPEFHQKVGLLTMRNMERALYGDTDGSSDLNPLLKVTQNGKPFTQIAMDMLRKSDSLTEQEVKEFFEYTDKLRNEMHAAIKELVKLQLQQRLTIEGKETLIRLIMVDESVKKCLELLAKMHPEVGAPCHSGKTYDFFIENKEESKRLSPQLLDSETTELKAESSPMVANNLVSSLNMAAEEANTFKASSTFKKASLDPDKLQEKQTSLLAALSGSSDIQKFLDALKKLQDSGITLSDLYSHSDTENNTLINTRKSQTDLKSLGSGDEQARSLRDALDIVLNELGKRRDAD